MFKDKESFKKAFIEKLEIMHGICLDEATDMDKYLTLGTMIREHLTKNWIDTNRHYKEMEEREVYYFSIEFLLGRLLGNNLLNLGLREICEEGLRDLGVDLAELESQEPDAGLGNGGLGRLAACFLDSIASLGLPGHGCGIRYKYGLFEQKVVDGYQVELPEYWLKEGNVWEIRKSEKAVEVRFGGQIRVEKNGDRLLFHHENYEAVLAVPYDIPITGYHNKTVNTLRLWNAEQALDRFDALRLGYTNQQSVLEYKYATESISQFLYPDDTHHEGRMLRLKQEYFFVSAGLQSIIRRLKKRGWPISELPRKVAVHINDTHPALAVAELMRILMDEEGLGWDEAFHLTSQTISYTNHTTLAEALETWPVELLRWLLPRIYMIIEELNERFCSELWRKYPGQWDRIGNMAIIAGGRVKMSHLAIAGSYSVNGVAKVHTEILKQREMRNFYEAFPHKFNNKTNGITHRRWLLRSNPSLAKLINETIGPGWIREPQQLIALRQYSGDAAFREQVDRIKMEKKRDLARVIRESCRIDVDDTSIFHIQVKRIHAYKRQILNVLYIMDLYNRLRDDPGLEIHPCTFILSGKAAPGYHLAKRTIKLISTVASRINADPAVKDRIKVVFLENYRVSLAEKIIPAADVSEQISTASKEASGTGNMKFMMNGAVTLGTLDGANIEILEEVGRDNMFIFGLTPSEVMGYYSYGGYCAFDQYNCDPRIKRVLDQLINGFLPAGAQEFNTIYDALLYHNDEFFVLKDFSSYVAAQEEVEQAYRDRERWLKMCIVNIAHSGKFSSDRTISEYASDIWKTNPVAVPESVPAPLMLSRDALAM
ncbi:MAG: glycogen/starch/alpha-glucan phosphorylase [Bacillota bacterium]